MRTRQDPEFVTFFIFVQADGADIIVVSCGEKTAFNRTSIILMS